MKRLLHPLIIFLLAPFWGFTNPIPYFIPPAGWDCVQPPKPDSYVQIGFLGKGQSELRPSLNLAIEKIDVPLKEYLKAVREVHETEMNVKWRDLGSFTFSSGKGRLAEITSSTPFGEMKMLQGIMIKDGFAYILTGAALKEEFSALQKPLLDAMHSLTVIPDLFSAISNADHRKRLQEDFQSFDQLSTDEERQTQWSLLQKTILGNYAFMGSYWQILILKEGHQRIFK
jgi:hypothetical protein